jgi:hypothetical protein
MQHPIKINVYHLSLCLSAAACKQFKGSLIKCKLLFMITLFESSIKWSKEKFK